MTLPHDPAAGAPYREGGGDCVSPAPPAVAPSPCAVETCDRPKHYSDGFCHAHHGRALDHDGDPVAHIPIGRPGQTFADHDTPLVCVCDEPRPDGVGECGACRRLVMSHSWHLGRPVVAS